MVKWSEDSTGGCREKSYDCFGFGCGFVEPGRLFCWQRQGQSSAADRHQGLIGLRTKVKRLAGVGLLIRNICFAQMGRTHLVIDDPIC
jgi:hypothetical protein